MTETTDPFEDRYPPHDDMAEIGVLAACFQSPVHTELARKILTGRDFYSPVHEAIFDQICALRSARTPVDHVTLGDRLRAIDPTLALPALRLMPTLALGSFVSGPEHHASIVRACATRRRIITTGTKFVQRAYNPEATANGLLDEMVREVASMRDANADDIETHTLAELIAEEDEPYDWVIPHVMERMDRLVLTGTEGLGKSTLLRQLAIFPAAGLHPFRPGVHTDPVRVHVIECENTKRHTKRQIRAMVAKARQRGVDPGDRVFFDFRPEGIDLMRDRDASWLHHALDATNPDLVVIGPFYKLFPRAVQTDDEAAPAIAALDAIRNRGCALVVEAHSGHSKGPSGKRDVRPRGSSALMGWPEFGYGLRPHPDKDMREHYGAVEVVPWRGDRDEGRHWPKEMGRGGDFPWSDLNYRQHGLRVVE